MTKIVEVVNDALTAAGIPVTGIGKLKPDRMEPGWFVATTANGHRIRIDFAPAATLQQTAQARAIVEGLSPVKRRERATQSILQSMDALTPAQLNKLYRALERVRLAEFLQQYPKFGREQGVPIDGDEA